MVVDLLLLSNGHYLIVRGGSCVALIGLSLSQRRFVFGRFVPIWRQVWVLKLTVRSCVSLIMLGAATQRRVQCQTGKAARAPNVRSDPPGNEASRHPISTVEILTILIVASITISSPRGRDRVRPRPASPCWARPGRF